MSAPLFTVFTPTFNRAHTLTRAFESLSSQTFRDFEWLVIDDGSTDGTRDLVERWKHEASFPIRYEHQINQGKMAAFNRGVGFAGGELFVPLDSDDELLPDALAKFTEAWQSCPPHDRDRFSGVTGLCLDVQRQVVGNVFPRSPLDSNTLEAVYRYKIRGEKQGFTRTSVLREFPFPEIHGTKYMPESIVWTRIARKYLTRYINEPVRIYHQDSGNQLTKSVVAHARGYAFWHCLVLNEQTEYFRYAPEEFLRSAIQYVRFSLHSGLRREIWGRLKNPLAKLLIVATLPVSVALFWRDRIRSSR